MYQKAVNKGTLKIPNGYQKAVNKGTLKIPNGYQKAVNTKWLRDFEDTKWLSEGRK